LRELGKRIGISHVSLRRIETGETDWNETTLSLLAQALGTDVPSLLARDPHQTEDVWGMWSQLSDADRRQLVDVLLALKVVRSSD
jgi:transcriptional regulator with XRE-family HTH domain